MNFQPSTFSVLKIIFVVFSITVTACTSQPKKPETITPELSFLHVNGHDMIDADSNKVFLKSIGLGNWMLPEGYMWKFGEKGDRPRRIEKIVSNLIGEEEARKFWQEFRENYITEADIRRIKELGFNAVRPALNARLFLTESDSPQFVEEGFILLENLVQWCKKYGLYVIIDMHGAPGGQTGANIDDSPNDLPELFMDVKHQDALVKLWVEIATRYKDEPTVAAYDLLNEPLPHRNGMGEKYGHLVEPLYKRLTDEIRKVDTKHMITLEGIDWSNDWSIFGEPFDDNTFYQFHYYCWDNPDNLKSVNYFIDERKKLNRPIWVGETGEKANAIYWGTTQYFELNNIGWSFWPWKKMDTKNTPYSIKKPANWDKIAAYTREGEKPDENLAKKAFNELLENIKLNNCEYFQDVTHAIFRKIPGKIEAENYLQGAYNETWFVADTSKKASVYRSNEFVPIELISVDSTTHKWKWYTEQAIELKKGEWVDYEINSDETAINKTRLFIKTNEPVSKLLFSNNGKAIIVELENTDWDFVFVGEIPIKEGINKIKIKVVKGSVSIDWMEFKVAQAKEE